MDEGIVNAFRKIENKIADEKLQKERAIELQRIKEVHEASERKRIFQERLIYSGATLFLTSICTVVYLANEDQIRADGGVKNWVVNVASSITLDMGTAQIDCDDPNNWSTKVCTNEKQLELENRWADMAIRKGTKEKPFAITQDSKK